MSNFESGLTASLIALFNKRLELDLELSHDILYQAWKKLKEGVEKEREHIISLIQENCVTTKTTIAARKALLTLPAHKKKVLKKSNPRHHLTSAESLNIMEEDYKSKNTNKARKMVSCEFSFPKCEIEKHKQRQAKMRQKNAEDKILKEKSKSIFKAKKKEIK